MKIYCCHWYVIQQSIKVEHYLHEDCEAYKGDRKCHKTENPFCSYNDLTSSLTLDITIVS